MEEHESLILGNVRGDTWLARELHDSVSQVLYGIGLGTRTAGALLDRADLAADLKGSLTEPLDYVLFSTWCMIGEDVERFSRWIDEGKIGRLDCYVGEIFPSQYADAHEMLCTVAARTGARTHPRRSQSSIPPKGIRSR